MFRIAKKVAITSVVLLVVGWAIFGTDLWSYMRTGAGWVTGSIREQVPLEFELQRAQDQIAALDPEIQNAMHAIAEEEVAVEKMADRVATIEGRLVEQRRQMASLGEAVRDGALVYTAGGRTYSIQEVKADLDRRMTRYERASQALETHQRILAARRKTLAAAEQKLASLRESKRELEAEVAEVRAQMKLVEAVEAANELQVDDSKLSQARRTLEKLRHELAVKQRLIEKEGILDEGIPVEEQPRTDTLARLDALLAETDPTVN